ncbi:MAG: DUF5658 family protein [Gammaproteobacteria bacterium]
MPSERHDTPTLSYHLSNRRRLHPRRQTCPLFGNWRFVLRGRRRMLRRASDQQGVCLDWHPTSLWLAALGILLLSATDAALTLVLIQHGATEANPLLRPLVVRDDVQQFLTLKLFLTAVPLVLLVAHSRLVIYGYIRVERVIYGLVLIYLAVIAYELTLLHRLTGT